MGMLNRCRRMMSGLLLVLVSTHSSACAPREADAARTPEQAARELAQLSTELGGLNVTLDRGADLALRSSLGTLTLELGREPSAAEQEAVRTILRTVLGEFLTAEVWEASITKVYSQHFSAEELDGLLVFYRSPLGRKSLELQSQLTEEVDVGMEEAVDHRIDEFIARVDEEIDKAFPELAGEEGS